MTVVTKTWPTADLFLFVTTTLQERFSVGNGGLGRAFRRVSLRETLLGRLWTAWGRAGRGDAVLDAGDRLCCSLSPLVRGDDGRQAVTTARRLVSPRGRGDGVVSWGLGIAASRSSPCHHGGVVTKPQLVEQILVTTGVLFSIENRRAF